MAPSASEIAAPPEAESPRAILKPTGVAAPVAQPSAVVSPLPDSAIDAGMPVTIAAPGFLAVRAVPYAKVFVRNRLVGTAEPGRAFVVSLVPGTYAVRLEHPRLIETHAVTIASGKRAALTFHVPLP